MAACLQGVIEGRSTLHVPLDVITQELDEQETTAHFMIAGSRGCALVSLGYSHGTR